jgi:hypothetical protein
MAATLRLALPGYRRGSPKRALKVLAEVDCAE